MSLRRIAGAGVAVLLTLALAYAQAHPELLVDPGGGRAAEAARRLATLDLDLEAEDVRIAAVALPLLTTPGRPVALTLPGARITVTGAIESRAGTDYTWFGKVAGDRLGSVILMVGARGVRGDVRTRGGQFRIVPLGDGLHAAVRISEMRVRVDESHGDEPPQDKEAGRKSWLWPGKRKPAKAVASNPPRTYTLGVLVAYTNEAKGAVADIEGDIALAAEIANLSFKNSEVGIRLKVAGTYATSYRETGWVRTDIEMDEVLGRRKTYGADVAVLVVSELYRISDGDRRNACGRSRAIGADLDDAFIVIRASCLAPKATLAHEIGHILGARHNWEKDRKRRPCGRYGHGLYSITGRWRTIMSYRCPSGVGACRPILYFSNPRIRDDSGMPLGDPELADNARCLNERIQVFCSGAAPCAPPDDE